MNNKNISPPKFATWLLRWYCRPQLLEDLEGDLNEYFERNVKSKGVVPAKLIYILDVLKFCRSYTIRRPHIQVAMNRFILYRNYYKTSFRTITRNKLFSSINVFGLAISMCVALLLIAFFTEVNSFDNFHKNGERIFRVNNLLHERTGGSYKYASTSVLTGREIRTSVKEVERMVSIHKGFNKDIHLENGTTIPLQGFWASEDFFRVFSFEVLSGNPLTALKEPNSIVMTETAAYKIFNSLDIIGKVVQVDTLIFTVTALLKDIPTNSHIRFEMLGSFSSIDNYMTARRSSEWLKWDNMWDHYVYIQLMEQVDPNSVQLSLNKISASENQNIENKSINLYLEPLSEIVLPRNMSNSIGPTVDRSTFTLLGGLCFVVILSACFNYTNLSIARALRRIREIGIRKSIGASRSQIFSQFICEAILLAMIALVFAFGLFLVISSEFVSMNVRYQEFLTLNPTLEMIVWFIFLGICIGLMAGFVPAVFFARLNSGMVLRESSGITLFKHINLRKGLIVFQYTLSILFIVLVSIGYRQYRFSLSFDLGFNTEDILSIEMQQNDPLPLIQELEAMPEVKQVARAAFVSSVGAATVSPVAVKHSNSNDSVDLNCNFVDERYIPLHEHRIVAGKNFDSNTSEESLQSSIIVNQHLLTWMKIKDPAQAIGEELTIEGKKHVIVAVVEDFNYERVNYPIGNFGFRYDPSRFEVLNVKIESQDVLATVSKIESVWKKIDPVHPLHAKFYKDQIEDAYSKLSWIITIVAFIAVLAISIASLGLLGMVIFTTETRIREITIRKVLGASISNLMLLMGKSFIWMLIISSVIAIPVAYLLMDKVIFGRVVYRASLDAIDVGLGALMVILVAMVMIGSQTWNVARTNPAKVLRNE